MRGLVLALALFVGSVAAAVAAKTGETDQPEMRVLVVRSDALGCRPDCSSWISAEGRITARTPALFAAVFKAIGKTPMPIVVTSGGGDVDGALEIGRMIRGRHFDVIVGHTLLAPCPADSKDCDAKADRGLTGSVFGFKPYCASACAFILAGGTQRMVPYEAYVGVHQIVSFVTYVRRQQTFSVRRRLVEGVPVVVDRRLVSEKIVSSVTHKGPGTPVIYEKIARYFEEMGITDAINPLMRATAPESMHWMTRDELTQTGLATDAISAGQVVERANAALRSATKLASLPNLAPIAKSPPPVPEVASPAPLTADIALGAGRFLDRNMLFFIHVDLEPDGQNIAISATAVEPVNTNGISLAPVAYNLTVRIGTGKERALVPVLSKAKPALAGRFSRSEFCQLRSDPLLKLAVLPGTLDGIKAQTVYVDAHSFGGMDALLAAACHGAVAATQ